MVLSGDWISPQIYGQYWYDKPIFYYWELALSFLVFVEVKTRRNRRYGEPIAAVTKYKQEHIRYTARVFLLSRGIENRRIRFDVVEVMMENGREKKIRHIKNAF